METKLNNHQIKIVVLDGKTTNPGDLSWDRLKELGQVTVYDHTTPDQVLERVADAQVVLLNKTPFGADKIAQLPQLKYIGVLATGYNTVNLEAAKRQGIVVCNVPAYSTFSVAQMAFAIIFAIVNRVEHYAEETRRGRWSESNDFCFWDTPLSELAGKTMGIVGLGNIGSKVACIARDFGMEVYAYTSKNSVDLPVGIQKTTLKGLFSVSDILSLHCPLNDQTRGMINEESLKLMKKGSILINTARGPLVDEQAVADALASGHLKAYGADVMSKEPPKKDNPLFQQPNAFITPHIAWATKEARARLLDTAIENVKAFINGVPQNVVSR